VGTPEEILLNPSDDYVRRFVTDVNRGRVVTAKSVAEKIPTISISKLNSENVRVALSQTSLRGIFVIAGDGSVVGGANRRLLESCGDEITVDQLLPVVKVLDGAVIDEVLHDSAATELPLAVTEKSGALFGAVSRQGLMSAIARKPVDASPN
jgi:glycine betaine/proline transport system ATP-binding protein